MALKIEFLKDFQIEKQKDNCKQLSLAERSVTYTVKFMPPMDCVAYQVDGNIIKDTKQDKCDKVVFARNGQGDITTIFVELKGSDVYHAIKQLEATLQFPLFERNRTQTMKARVVSNRIPANTGNSVVERAKIQFRKKFNCELLCLKPGNPDTIKG